MKVIKRVQPFNFESEKASKLGFYLRMVKNQALLGAENAKQHKRIQSDASACLIDLLMWDAQNKLDRAALDFLCRALVAHAARLMRFYSGATLP